MPLHVFALVLLAALLHAAWNTVIKKGEEPVARLAWIAVGFVLCGTPLAVYAGLPSRAAWPLLAASVLLHQVYFALLIQGYRAGDLSTVYPIARGLAPLLVSIGGFVVAAERPSALGAAAVVVLSLGVLSLAVVDRGNRRAVGYAVATGILIAAYSVVDGLGGRRADNVLSYVSWLFVLQGIPIICYACWRGQMSGAARRAGLVGGLFAFIAYGLVIWAMSIVPMGYVSGLREVSVVFAAVIGARMLGEPLGKRRIAAAAVIAVGAALLPFA